MDKIKTSIKNDVFLWEVESFQNYSRFFVMPNNYCLYLRCNTCDKTFR